MTVDLAEIARYMRMGRAVPEGALAGRVEGLLGEALKTVRPARVWRRFPFADDAIECGALRIDARGTFARHLAGCHAAYLVCTTIGTAFDALQRRTAATSPSDAFILQAIGAAAIEAWTDETELEIRRELKEGETLVSRYSPGYGDYPLDAQRTLFDLLDAPRTVGVSLTDNLLMVPSKSVSAIIGVKKEIS